MISDACLCWTTIKM